MHLHVYMYMYLPHHTIYLIVYMYVQKHNWGCRLLRNETGFASNDQLHLYTKALACEYM